MHNHRETRIAELEEQLVETERQLIALHQQANDGAPPPPLPPSPPHNAQPPPPPPGAVPTSPRPAAAPQARSISAEFFLRYGGISLVVASAIFFVSTAISRGWIGPTSQLLLASVTSLAMIGQSFRFSSEQRAWQITMAIGGSAALFASGVVGYIGLEVLSFPVAVAWLVGSIGMFLGLSIAHDAESVALGSVPATFLGVVLLRIAVTYDPWLLSCIAAIYVVAIALVTYRRSWFVARASGAILGSLLASFALVGMVVDEGSRDLLAPMTVVSILSLLFVATAQALEFRSHEQSQTPPLLALIEARATALTIPWIAIASAAVASTLELVSFDPLWVIAIVAAVFGLVVAVMKPFPETMRLLHLGAAIATMATALIGVLDGPVLLIALLGQAILAGFVAHRFSSPDLSVLLALLASGVTLLTLQYVLIGTFDQGLTWIESLSVLLVVISATALSAWLRNDAGIAQLWIVPWLLAMGWASATFRDLPQGQMVVTLIWALIGAGLVYLASRTLDREFMTAGLSTLAVTAGKLIFVDLIAVDVLWRAGLFFIVGTLFMRLAFVLPKLMDPPAPGHIASNGTEDPEAPDSELVGSGTGLG